MAKTTFLNIRVYQETKEAADVLFANFGLSPAEAVSIFFHQSILLGKIPFDFYPYQNIVEDEPDDEDEDGEVIDLEDPKNAALKEIFGNLNLLEKPE
ncbi:type II toxin-antitoxin system RelB/DinJ family antitoxin [Synergistaceae bacterium OttesenSCG-928-D05]|nr:type II toxin-antitoxin system RelB/DinJ family antitoxin [Synergistaceae bacterium OttesenSCG-928-D05]